jgi:hypothetical protein
VGVTTGSREVPEKKGPVTRDYDYDYYYHHHHGNVLEGSSLLGRGTTPLRD